MGKIFHQTFRRRRQRPKNILDLEDDRTVTFLELFYDLSYVAIVAQVGHTLVGHLDWTSLIKFMLLFAMMFWAWLNGTLYHELHGNNDIRSRLFTFAQMIFLVGMGVFAHAAFDGMYQWFAGSYALFLIVIAYLRRRTGVYDPLHKPLSQPYVVGFSITILMFIISIFVDRTTAYYLRGGGVAVSFLLPFVLQHRGVLNEADPRQLEVLQKTRPSLVERFGLLTIIMLGEIIIATVAGAAGLHDMGLYSILIILGCVGLALGMWRVYFDTLSHRPPKIGAEYRNTWMFAHFPLTMSIVLVGVGVSTIFHDFHHRSQEGMRLIIAGVAGFFLCVIAISQLIQLTEIQQIGRRPLIRGCIVGLAIVLVSVLWLQQERVLLGINVALLTPIAMIFTTYAREMVENNI